MVSMRSLILIVGAFLLLPGRLAAQAPWEVNKPIAKVKRELLRKHPKPKVSVGVIQGYRGPGLELEETVMYMAKSDTPFKPKRRRSSDNGRTWSAFEPVPELITYVDSTRIFWGPVAMIYDPSSEALVAVWLRQTKHKGTYYNHCLVRLSRDNGRTWSEPQLLRYEEGNDFNPNDPFNPDFLNNNSCYPGTNLYIRRDGSLLFPGSCCNVPDDAPDLNPEKIPSSFKGTPAHGRGGGAANFVGRWDAASGKYDWTASNVVWVPRHVSSRGLSEPSIAELTDGRLLTIYRCSNVKLKPQHNQPGRKRYTISTDGGKTISQPMELKYNDGTRFYSPSSIHQLIRHSQTGKLYWVGNINMNPAEGNHYCYPLVIAEVDEANVALKKNTVTLIGGRRPGDGKYLQLSNFSLLENRETHQFEICLARLGEDPSNTWNADAYKYTLTLMPDAARE